MNGGQARRVVVGVDGSAASDAAVRYAGELAVRRGAALQVVHVYEAPRLTGHGLDVERVVAFNARQRYAAELLVAAALEDLRAAYLTLDVSARVSAGGPAQVLIQASRAAQVVVLGVSGTGATRHVSLGSTTQRVAARSLAPVIAVPAPVEQAHTRHGIVVGVDDASAYDAALGFAFGAAAEMQETLLAVHAWHPPAPVVGPAMLPLVGDSGLIAHQEQVALEEALGTWPSKFPDVVLEKKVVRSRPVAALVAESRTARLLVVGCRGRANLTGLFLGSVSRGLLPHTACPVAVVRALR
ncbi:MAG: universal stress protein [Actinomycetes bacterium]